MKKTRLKLVLRGLRNKIRLVDQSSLSTYRGAYNTSYT